MYVALFLIPWILVGIGVLFIAFSTVPVMAGAQIWGSTMETCQMPMSFAASSPPGSTSSASAQSTAW